MCPLPRVHGQGLFFNRVATRVVPPIRGISHPPKRRGLYFGAKRHMRCRTSSSQSNFFLIYCIICKGITFLIQGRVHREQLRCFECLPHAPQGGGTALHKNPQKIDLPKSGTKGSRTKLPGGPLPQQGGTPGHGGAGRAEVRALPDVLRRQPELQQRWGRGGPGPGRLRGVPRADLPTPGPPLDPPPQPGSCVPGC